MNSYLTFICFFINSLSFNHQEPLRHISFFKAQFSFINLRSALDKILIEEKVTKFFWKEVYLKGLVNAGFKHAERGGEHLVEMLELSFPAIFEFYLFFFYCSILKMYLYFYFPCFIWFFSFAQILTSSPFLKLALL